MVGRVAGCAVRRGVLGGFVVGMLVTVLAGGVGSAEAVDPTAAEFVLGINLGGPPVTIDGRRWEGNDSRRLRSKDRTFENQKVPLVPSTDSERSAMIRSSRWGGNDLAVVGLTPGRYTVFLTLWEDNDSETFSIALAGRAVVPKYVSGTAGRWERLGPWPVDVSGEGTIRIVSRGGAANFSGLEIWRGDAVATPAPLAEEAVAFFESRIRPILVAKCYDCHSERAGVSEADLFLDTRGGMARGGVSGPALMPGDIKASLILQAVRHEADSPAMPPDEPLDRSEIADLERWVSLGAPDPRDGEPPVKVIDWTAAREFWSLRPVVDPPVPTVTDIAWAATPIDRFIRARQEAIGLAPTGPADKRTLIRRATIDLTGLPPTEAEIDAFLADETPAAFATVVDRLLASPRYGERWGRHWMDLVRYADTAGDNSDFPVPEAFRYRNYIIDALNADKPYDRFLTEQLAGDLLPARTDAQRDEQVVATGYVASARRFGSLLKSYPQHLTIEDTIDNLGRTVLGLTISCARCHDHKFDPIRQDDYYGLYGIFASTRYPFPGIELQPKRSDFVPLRAGGAGGKDLAYAVVDGDVGDSALQRKGDPERPGPVVPRHFPGVLGGQTLPPEGQSSSGRRELASWLTDPANPLTARVMVNRVWHYHFGTGLVATPSDFGVRGTPPTHPELLDYLAARFVADGWSLKAIHRRILLSSVYQLAGADHAEGLARDVDNHTYWKFGRRRIDAETLRDSVLMIAGDLDWSMPRSPHPFPDPAKWKYTQHHPFRESYETAHRTVYQMSARLNARPFDTTFDGADRNATSPRRDTSVTALQGLYLLNDPFVHARATTFAGRLMAETEGDEARLRRAFLLTTGRPVSEAEAAASTASLTAIREALADAGVPAGEVEREAWAALFRSLIRTNAFLYVE